MKKIVISSIAMLTLTTVSVAAPVNPKECASCHGVDWSRKALNTSRVVKDLTHAQIAAALKGYKAGTIKVKIPGLMKSKVSKYTDAELEAFAQTIGK